MKDEIDIVVLNKPVLGTSKYKELEGVGQLITEIVLSLLSWMVEEERDEYEQRNESVLKLQRKKVNIMEEREIIIVRQQINTKISLMK